MTNVAIIGASGCVGGELLRLLLHNPHVRITAVTSEQLAGKPVHTLFPNLRGHDLFFEALNSAEVVARADVMFLPLPHTYSFQTPTLLIYACSKLIDLTSAFP